MNSLNFLHAFLDKKIDLTSLCRNYDISENGFVPLNNTDRLPEQYRAWEDCCSQLSTHIKNKTLDDAISKLPLISPEELITPEQKKRAYLVLCMMGNGYLWRNGRNDIPQKLPENIAYPWDRVSESLGLKPVLTHAAVDLYNCIWSSNMDAVDPDQMDCLFTLTGTRDEKWFYLIMSAIELEGAKGIYITFNLLKAYYSKNNEEIVKELNNLAKNIKDVELILKRMMEKDDNGKYKCEPAVFWNELRIFLSGSADAGMFPNGLEYESSNNPHQKHNGGSAAQSSLIQLYDAVLNIQHPNVHTRKFLLSMRYYMPASHRRLLEDIEGVSRLRDYVMLSDDEHLKSIYQYCVDTLTEFRKYHLYIVKRYVLDFLPEEAKKHAKGSGGTTIEEFLVISKEETEDSTIDDKKALSRREEKLKALE